MPCFGPFQEKNAQPITIKARYEVLTNTSVLLQMISFYLRVSALVKVSPKCHSHLLFVGFLTHTKIVLFSSFFLSVRYL